MKRLCNVKLMSAAIAAAAMIAVPAFGQTRVGQDGHSNDASNRVGSGGYNSPGSVYSNGLNQNNFIYNNVTGLSGFTGPVRERDPQSFAGPVPVLSDSFIQRSAGAPTSYQAPLIGNAPTAFYGSDRAVAPPIGTERLGYTQSYIGTPYTPSDTNALGSEITSALDVQRQQLGTSSVLGVGSKALDIGNPATQIDQGGPLEAINSAGNFVGSPLYGLQGLSGPTPADITDFGLPVFATPSSSSFGTGRFRTNSTTQVDQFQKELLDNGEQDQTQNGLNSGINGNSNAQSQSPDSLAPGSLARSVDSPNNRRLSSQQVNSAIGGNNAMAGGVNMQQGTQERLMSPQRQSTQYNILSQRLAQLTNPQVSQIQAAVSGQSRVNQALTSGKNGSAAGGAPATQPAIGTAPGALEIGTAPAVPYVEPLKIQSLAEGISAKGLHDLLSDAEKLMKAGKFESAIQKYNVAQRVAPNNGLIPLGRANAELGAGYYYQASADLHQVFQADPALLMGQYNLKNWISDKRLQFITNELRDLSASDPKQETPAFLLAYISYNTGQESQAQTYLREAKARSHGRDPLLSQLESRWKPSAAPGGLEMNK